MKFQRITGLLLLTVAFASSAGLAQSVKARKQPISSYTLSDSSRYKTYFLNGLREKMLGNTNGAIRNFLLCIDANPNADAAYYELAQTYLSLDQAEQALPVVNKAVRLNAEQSWYFILKANIQERLGQYLQAADTYGKIKVLLPDDEDNYYAQANAYTLGGKPEEAMRVFRQLEIRFGSSDELTLQRQKLFIRTGNIAEATKEMEILIRQNPDELRYYMMAGELYDSNNLPEKAFEKYQQALKIDPTNGYVHLALADYYKDKGNTITVFEEVKKAFFSDDIDLDTKVRLMYSNYVNPREQSIKADAFLLSNILVAKYPKEGRVFAINGDFLFMINRKEDAAEAYKKAIALDKKNYTIWEQLARIQFSISDYQGVQETCDEAILYYPDKAMLYLYNGMAKKQLGNSKEAILAYTQGLTYCNNSIDLQTQFYSNMGDAYHAIGNYQESDKAYDKSLDLNPNNAFVLNNYAFYLSLRGKDLDKAERMIRKANALEQGNSSYEDTYAWVLYKLGRYADARIWIEKAMRNNSNSATLAEHYGDILFKLGYRDMAISNWKKAREFGSKSESLERKINDQALHD
ncbi:tetratricopeptide repeat protein [Solitalea koreensis]|uniref:Tetratricopeptide repeat-containing protein n=1 Tax=Solitalea koreensis TaxID=543615 RepID=A0A521CTP7_9SPHI|nr:tetratricopeptide repeat protein [Solitalea koreensis]SMO62030.1 Tetratricopeptide repeat-containing protein [Solitalea koreensis]